MPKKQSPKLTPKQHAQSMAYLGLFIGFILAYVPAEIILAVRPHPYHWLTALVGGLLIGSTIYFVSLWQMTHRS